MMRFLTGTNSGSYNLTRLLATILLTSLMLGACGGTPSATPFPATTSAPKTATPTPKSGEQVTLKWSFWGDASELEIKNRVRKQFEAEHPNIKIEMVTESWGNYFNRLRTEWIGDKAPDIMFLDNIPTWAGQGYLENISPLVERDKLDTSDFYKGLLDMFRYNGALYGLPRDNDTKVIYVNKELLAEAGISVPKAGWTWQNLRDVAKQLTKRDASGNVIQYGFAFEPGWWRLWVWQNGGALYDSFTPPLPPTKLLLDSPESIEAIQFLADMIYVDKITPSYTAMDSGDKIAELFKNRKLAMAFGNHSQVALYGQTPKLQWDVVPLPAGKKRVNILGGAGYVLNKNSKHKEEAWTFLKWLTGPVGQAIFADTGVMVPSRKSVREDNIYLRQQPYNTKVFLEETELGQPYPEFLLSAKVDSLLNEHLQPVWEGKAKAQDVLPKLPALVEPIFTEAKNNK